MLTIAELAKLLTLDALELVLLKELRLLDSKSENLR